MFEPKERKFVKVVEGIDFTFNIPSISANSSYSLDLHENGGNPAKYVPYDQITIDNNSSSDIELSINDDSSKTYLIFAKSSRTIELRNAIRRFSITEKSGNNISANQIRVVVSKIGMDSDGFAKAVAKNVFMRYFLGLG
ncbi:MAG: hypothetical protein ACTSWZ_00705 [Candidatus Heimdallarchaeaceae archaeon]